MQRKRNKKRDDNEDHCSSTSNSSNDSSGGSDSGHNVTKSAGDLKSDEEGERKEFSVQSFVKQLSEAFASDPEQIAQLAKGILSCIQQAANSVTESTSEQEQLEELADIDNGPIILLQGEQASAHQFPAAMTSQPDPGTYVP